MTMSQAHQAYIDALPDDQRRCLTDLHELVSAILPDAEQIISYAMPAFRTGGKVVAGFSAFKRHLGFYPFSGSIIPGLAEDVRGFKSSKSGVLFTPDRPLPPALVRKIIELRLAEIG